MASRGKNVEFSTPQRAKALLFYRGRCPACGELLTNEETARLIFKQVAFTEMTGEGAKDWPGIPSLQKLITGTSMETHHIIPIEDGGTSEQKNLLPLCPNCHRKITKVRRNIPRELLSELDKGLISENAQRNQEGEIWLRENIEFFYTSVFGKLKPRINK